MLTLTRLKILIKNNVFNDCIRAITCKPNILKNISKVNNENSTIYNPIFKSAYMPTFICLNKLKKMSAISNCVVISVSFGFKIFDLLNYSEVMYISMIGIGLTTGLLTSCWLLSDRLVIYAYISDDELKCRMSYISFWGNRNELYCNIDDIKPIKNSKLDFFNHKIKFVNNNNSFKIILQDSTIINNAKFRKIFGDQIM
ncbi:transmembrane protein 186-like [Daktulosphaira vitifoliae]|uniref:transmembrane protein 186-like n=1 Tax=Daktulosphaira vitifoliae TaxID=58002 RepID=UPI0021AA23E4|nr:transmembrane protein 186-like [Daktulosphaira vitifoliae]